MLNKYILILCWLVVYCTTNAQTWLPVGAGTLSGDNTNYAPGIYAMAEYNGLLYVGGWFDTIGGVAANNIASWNGTNWAPVANGVGGVNAMTVYNGQLYVGGFTGNYIGAYGSVPLATWNGAVWDTVTIDTLGLNNASVNSFAQLNGNLYVGGQGFVWEWTGANWISAPNTGVNPAAQVISMAAYNGNLYATAGGDGSGDSIGGYNVPDGISVWNGTGWDSLNQSLNYGAYVLTTFNGSLYAGGYEGNPNVVCKSVESWNGQSWDSLGPAVIRAGIFAMAVIGNKLYVGGDFDSIGNIPAGGVASWDGANWQALGTGTNFYGGIDALAEYNGYVYAGGTFDSLGGNALNKIARWSVATAINPLSPQQEAISVYPNPAGNVLMIKNTQPGMLITVSNILGQQLIKTIATGEQEQLNVAQLPAGIYLLNHLKFVKE